MRPDGGDKVASHPFSQARLSGKSHWTCLQAPQSRLQKNGTSKSGPRFCRAPRGEICTRVALAPRRPTHKHGGVLGWLLVSPAIGASCRVGVAGGSPLTDHILVNRTIVAVAIVDLVEP